MKERGMIFNAEMVRALLNGNKSQTRRPLKNQPIIDMPLSKGPMIRIGNAKYESFNPQRMTRRCPFGQVGDRIWVRETFRLFDHSDECGASDHCSCPPTGTPIYRADFDDMESKWTPSIHMPRSASRIKLEITEVRVERLQDISEKDAIAEGVQPNCSLLEHTDCDHGGEWFRYGTGDEDYPAFSAKESYQSLWQTLYGNWDENPWVYVIEFKKVDA